MERRIVSEAITSGFFGDVLRHVYSVRASVDKEDLRAGLEGLATILATEEFETLRVSWRATAFCFNGLARGDFEVARFL